MATTTETQTSSVPMPNGTHSPQSERAAPEIRFLTRVVSIPLVSSSLQTINDTLESNAYLKTPYTTAKDLSASAYKYTEPLQARLAPLIVRADGYANMAVDMVESRYPYPFQAKPEDVATYMRERRDSAVEVANKSFDEKVKSPALNVAQGIDNRFAPIVDYVEARISPTSEAGPSTPPDAKYQYQRALALSRSLRDRAFVYSSDQLKYIQAHSALVNRAMGTAQNISELASSSLASAQSRIHALSDTMLLELQKIQASAHALSTSLATSASDLQASLRSQASHIPPQVQDQLAHIHQQYNETNAALSNSISELKSILTAQDVPIQEKVGRLASEVKDQVTPVLAALQERISSMLPGSKTPAQDPAEVGAQPNGNGRANRHAKPE